MRPEADGGRDDCCCHNEKGEPAGSPETKTDAATAAAYFQSSTKRVKYVVSSFWMPAPGRLL